jgi:hypothetical protein
MLTGPPCFGARLRSTCSPAPSAAGDCTSGRYHRTRTRASHTRAPEHAAGSHPAGPGARPDRRRGVGPRRPVDVRPRCAPAGPVCLERGQTGSVVPVCLESAQRRASAEPLIGRFVNSFSVRSPLDRLSAGWAASNRADQVFETTDNGGTWTAIGTPIDPDVTVFWIDVAKGDPNRLYVSGARGLGTFRTASLLVSTDKGMTWSERLHHPQVSWRQVAQFGPRSPRGVAGRTS